MYASPPSLAASLKSACFMPDCGLTIYSQQKNMGGNHDKVYQVCPTPTLKPVVSTPQIIARCNSAGCNGRDHDSGLCGDRSAIGPNGRPNLANPATLGTATRGPLSGFSPGSL